ncbi:hypothetical protein D9Q98_000220 [Chlorella vulgaris]|uniref:Two-component response regulator n=1 Tax=Chlorella vulgaris TaxID=3077 RepID=A0A9D4TXT3_CHLVU|nr:hypothetical protein D9Q98_000220 [Chlorella vulgaris]
MDAGDDGSSGDNANAGAACSSGGDSGLFSPSGLRVLVVDDDPMCLKVVSAMLQRCNYEVDTRSSGQDALLLLRDRQEQNHQFDLVLSDVYMPDMDGFKLLELIGLELDLPVIMMSSNGDTDVVLRGVTHGAVDFLIKPVRVEELRNVWQHVVRRRSLHTGGRSSDEHSNQGDEQGLTHQGGVKRKESETIQVQHDTQGGSKKPRVVWSVEMHQQFVDAVSQLGVDKAVPKRILDLMNVDGLTRENVASHLQKYRLYLKRAQGLQGGKGGKGQKASHDAALVDSSAAAAAAAAAAAQAGPNSVFAQVAAQQAAGGAAPGGMGPGMSSPQGMMHPGMAVLGMAGPTSAAHHMAAAWQQQHMAMQAAAAASGALPAGMHPAVLPFPLPPGAVMTQHMAAMAAGMPVGLVGAPAMAAISDGNGGFTPMVFPQQQQEQQHQQSPQQVQQPQQQQQQQQQQAGPGIANADLQQSPSHTAAVPDGTPVPSPVQPPQVQPPGQQPGSAVLSGVKLEPGGTGVAPAFPGLNDSAMTAHHDLMSSSRHLSLSDSAALPNGHQHDGLKIHGGLGDTESLMDALNPDSFLADVPLPRLDMDDFLDSFLSSE